MRKDAVAWIGQALREEYRSASDEEIRAAAELYDAIAQAWSIPVGQVVTWIHLQASPNLIDFKAYCVARHLKGQKRRSEYPD